jgi:hypothetical protein
MSAGHTRPLSLLPFDHGASFQTGMFGWKGTLTAEQTARISAAKQAIDEGPQTVVAAGVPKDRAVVAAGGRG